MTAPADDLRPPRILFIPDLGDVRTSERTPVLFRLLRERHPMSGLRLPLDRFVYDTHRARLPRYALYLLGEALGGLRGLRTARARGLQVAFCETPHHALIGLWVARVLGLRCVWDSHGNALLFAKSVGKGPIYTFLSVGLDRFLARRVDLLVTVTERDADAYTEMGIDRSKVFVVPTSVQISELDRLVAAVPHPPPKEGRPVILFFGNFRYAPNREALRFVNERLAPHLEREGIPAEIHLAGRDIPRTSLHPSVRNLGFVENLPACIRHADLCIVPVWTGVGMLTKVVDIMAAGTPAVLTTFAASGIPEIRDGVHARIAADEASFCSLVADSLRHPATMAALARNARRLVQETYDWAVQVPRLDRRIAALLDSPAG